MPVASATGSTSPLVRLTRDYSAGGAGLALVAEPRPRYKRLAGTLQPSLAEKLGKREGSVSFPLAG
jgi:hypothetical protein